MEIPKTPITIGLLINPIAGMGGKVGLKGTDEQYDEAIRRGAEPEAAIRAISTLRLLKNANLSFLTCSGEMGEAALRSSGISSFEVVYRYSGASSAQDTMNACRNFLDEGVMLILFCGGDGTAHDVYSVVQDKVPILGIPAGVKMYSAVFGVNPVGCAEVVGSLKETVIHDSEVVDVDEEAYREGVLSTRIYGYARVPSLPLRIQTGKQEFIAPDEEGSKKDIALFITEIMRNDTAYILGAGTTTEEIARQLGIQKTLLGVDVVLNGEVLARDTDERTILSLLDTREKAKIIVSPIGAQGFVLGRGTQALSPAIIRKVGIENIVVIATPYKLAKTRTLFIDTGDEEVDRLFGDSILVISGYRMGQRRKLLHPESPNEGGPKDYSFKND